MKTKHFLAALSACIMVLAGSSAMAMGFGYSIHYGIGKNYWLDSATKNLTSETGDVGLGLTLDTNLAKDRLLSYRMDFDLGFGMENFKTFQDFVRYSHEPFLSLTMVHTLGFGVYRSNIVRFWLGPQLSLGGIYGIPSPYFSFNKRKNIWGIHGGLGGAIGLNINPGEWFTLSLTAAVRGEGAYLDHYYERYTHAEVACVNMYPMYALMLLMSEKHGQDSGIRVYGQFNITFMFRVNDSFSAARN